MRNPLLLAALLALPLIASADFRFIHDSDTHVGAKEDPGSNAAKDAAMYREISTLDPQPAFVVNTGDYVEAGIPAEYAIHAKILAANLKTPQHGAPGNHDVRWNPLGKEGYTKGSGQPLYASWDHAGVHFVTLDSTVLLQHWGHIDQKELDWLADDLAKAGKDTPVVIGFHHWIGRDVVQVDNERALLDVVAPYNVRLWLQGHGHSDIQWSINGAHAIMCKGLYQGSYNIIDVTKDSLVVSRRALPKANPGTELLVAEQPETGKVPGQTTPLFTIPLARPIAPTWQATATQADNAFEVSVTRGDLPPDAKLELRLDAGKYEPLKPDADRLRATVPTTAMLPGHHLITVQATLPDGRAYQKPLDILHAPAGSPKPAWETQVHGAVQSHLVRAADALYISTMSGNVYNLDPATGAQRWKFAAGDSVFSTPLLADGVVYFGSADHFVYAVDAATGTLKWKHETGGAVFASAAVAQGVVCIASVDQTIYGLDAATGKPAWTVKSKGMYQSQAATDGQHFFLGGWDNAFRCLDAKTGQPKWVKEFGWSRTGTTQPPKGQANSASPPATRRASLARLGPTSFYYSPAIASPAIADGRAYITSNDGILHAVQIETGEVLWEFDNHKVGYSSPIVNQGRVYVAIGDPTLLFCLDAATGEKLWQSPAPSVVYDSTFAFSAGSLFIGSVNGILSAYDAKTGVSQWKYSLGAGHLLASPAADDQRVYISSMSGKVRAMPLMP